MSMKNLTIKIVCACGEEVSNDDMGLKEEIVYRLQMAMNCRIPIKDLDRAAESIIAFFDDPEKPSKIEKIIDKRITQHEDNAFTVLNQILEQLKDIKQTLHVQQHSRVV